MFTQFFITLYHVIDCNYIILYCYTSLFLLFLINIVKWPQKVFTSILVVVVLGYEPRYPTLVISISQPYFKN